MAIRWQPCIIVILSLSSAGTALGQPKGPQPWWPVQPTPLPFVHPLFTDDMVLQRDMQAPIWGWSTPGDTIAVAVDGKASGKEAIAGKDGKWMTKIGPFSRRWAAHADHRRNQAKGHPQERAVRRRLALLGAVEHELAGPALELTRRRKSRMRTIRRFARSPSAFSRRWCR